MEELSNEAARGSEELKEQLHVGCIITGAGLVIGSLQGVIHSQAYRENVSKK